jgi:hypothetical protein
VGTYVRDVEEANGDLIDVLYFCSRGCWSDSFAEDRIGPAGGPEDENLASEGGASPCSENEAGEDIDVHCAECGVLMASPDKRPPTVVNLIERPPICEFTNQAEPVA